MTKRKRAAAPAARTGKAMHPSWNKFAAVDKGYFEYIEWLEKQGFANREIVFNFPVFVGQVNLARFLMLYELYDRVKQMAGDLADVGTFKGASFLFMAKLLALFERETPAQVHGFDWFEGMKPGARDDAANAGRYVASYETLIELVRRQSLDDVAVLHRMDLTREFVPFLRVNPHLRFKLAFVDCGIAAVLKAVIGPLWERTVPGGVMVFDHFNNESSPAESDAIQAVVGNARILRMPYVRQPTAYVVKDR